MSDLLRRLLSYLFPQVGGEGDPPTEPAPDDAAPPEGDEPTIDDLVGDEPEPTPTREAETAREREARERAERAERDLAAERSRQQPAAAPARATDPDFEREEQQLREAQQRGATEAEIYWLRYKIDNDRNTRMARREAYIAREEARDTRDSVAFYRETEQAVVKKYAKRIEEAIAESRRRGEQPIPRAALLRLFVGDDMLAGKTKKSKPASAASSAAAVPRGKMPGARSDVSGRGSGGQTERDKLRARLENVNI